MLTATKKKQEVEYTEYLDAQNNPDFPERYSHPRRFLWNDFVIEATKGDEICGYVRISHVSMELFEKSSLFDPWVFYAEFHNSVLKNSLDDLRELWYMVFRYVPRHLAKRKTFQDSWGIRKEEIPNDQDEIREDLKRAEEYLKISAKQKDFIEYHVEKPNINFIKVEPEYQRQGIGTELYVRASKLVHKHLNLPLYSSSTPSRSAAATWKKMYDNQTMPIYKRHFTYYGEEKFRYVADWRKK